MPDLPAQCRYIFVRGRDLYHHVASALGRHKMDAPAAVRWKGTKDTPKMSWQDVNTVTTRRTCLHIEHAFRDSVAPVLGGFPGQSGQRVIMGAEVAIREIEIGFPDAVPHFSDRAAAVQSIMKCVPPDAAPDRETRESGSLRGHPQPVP
jgi:hypothetical protein